MECDILTFRAFYLQIHPPVHKPLSFHSNGRSATNLVVWIVRGAREKNESHKSHFQERIENVTVEAEKLDGWKNAVTVDVLTAMLTGK